MVSWLAASLVEAGHEVHVAALEGSRLPAGTRLIPMQHGRVSALDLAGRLPSGVDVVHFHAPPEEGALERLPCAGIVTIHGNGKPGERFPVNSVFLSRDHALRHGASAFVYNGVDPAELEFRPESKTERYLFLSRTGWRVKNLRGAVRLCRSAGANLEIAGGHRPIGLRVRVAFERRFRWYGPVSGMEKASLLSRAKALLFPVLWDEPFGLVVAEALMSGTPVLASRRGSLPELVTMEVGALLETDAEWLAWLRRPKLPWDPVACRERAMRLFHRREMAQAYAVLYKKVMAGERLHERPPEGIVR